VLGYLQLASHAAILFFGVNYILPFAMGSEASFYMVLKLGMAQSMLHVVRTYGVSLCLLFVACSLPRHCRARCVAFWLHPASC
jgi:hypothetical protein